MLHWHFKAPTRQDDPTASGPADEDRMSDPAAQLAETTPLGAYEALRDRAERALWQGDLGTARRLYEQAQALAGEIGDPDLVDRARCNLAALLVETGEGQLETYLTIKLTNTMISGYSFSSGGDRPSESISLNFTKIEYTYQGYDDQHKVDTSKKQTVIYDATLAKKV